MADDNKTSASEATIPTPSGSTREQRASKRKMSTAGLQYIREEIEYLKPYELSCTQRLNTYAYMLFDTDVSTPYNKTKEMVEESFSTYHIDYNKNSAASKEAAEFMKYCVEIMFDQHTSPRSVAGHAFTFAQNRLAIAEKGFEKIPSGKYEGLWALSGLFPIGLSTLDQVNPFKIATGGNKIEYARQRTSAFKNNLDTAIKDIPQTKDGFRHIQANKLAMFTDSGNPLNPFGISIFDQIYDEWRFKKMVKDILLTGVAKDLVGTPIFYVPSIVMEEAEADPQGWQADFLRDLDKQAAAMHNGDQSFIRLPSDPHEGASSLREFEVKFLGVEGGAGKGFDLVSILDQSKKAIYNAFGAQNLLTGESGGGSYNLIEGQNSNHAFTVKRNVTIIEEVWNKDIWPQVFRLNEWDLEPEDIPKFRAGQVDPVSMDELGKFMQRTVTSGIFPITPATVNWFLSQSGIPYQFEDEATLEDMMKVMPAMNSKSGQGNGTSGTGDSQNASGGDNNAENAA